MEYFSPYLIGKPFKARTDHNALKWIKNFKKPKGQVARWIERLAVFDFEIEHRPGRNHGSADGVSRIPNLNSSTETSVPKSATDRVHNLFNLWCHRRIVQISCRYYTKTRDEILKVMSSKK